jgi:peptide/nickel transport system permease protein
MTYSLRAEPLGDGDFVVSGALGVKVYRGRSREPMVMHSDTDVAPVVESVSEDSEEIQSRSLRQIALARLRKDRVAVVCFFTLVVILVLAGFAPIFTRLIGIDPYTYHPKQLSAAGSIPGGWKHSGVSLHHPLGLEPLTGRDILARLLYGARISLAIALSATFITVFVGVIVGIISGYSRGLLDTVLGRLMDLLLSFPQLLIILALASVIVQRLASFHITGNFAQALYLVIVLSVFSWPYIARVVRGQVLSLREREFVEAAVSLGAPTRWVLFREILPNLWAPILVYTSLTIPVNISAEATLSFLGVGVQEPSATWGSMLSDSVSFFIVDPLYLFIPGTLLVVVVLAFNLLGDSVRDALDPRAGRS